MRTARRFGQRAIVSTVGMVLGVAAALATVNWATAAARPAGMEPSAVFDATHLPPLLTLAHESLELAYDVHCVPADDEVHETGCDVHGSVFVRATGEGAFAALLLEERTLDGRRQLAVEVPEALAASGRGLEYFAVLGAPAVDQRLVVPAGGPAAPHVSRRLASPIEVDLGRNAFFENAGRRTGLRVASATWGDGAGKAGLEQGRNLDPIGASAFDVDSQGDIYLLDQAHRRIQRWSPGARSPHHVPVSVAGTLADLAVADDGSLFVLETTAPPGRNPLVRRFDEGGRELEAVEAAERSMSQIRIDARGPSVLGGSSHQWMPVQVDGMPASPAVQSRYGRVGRGFAGGVEVVVLRTENEIRTALVSSRGVIRSWRVTSSMPLAEVQLAEPLGQRLVLVVRAYAEGVGGEFVVLTLDRNGLIDRFAVDSSDWAETAPLGRFKLEGRSLYRLGSTPAGVFVDRFDLEVR